MVNTQKKEKDQQTLRLAISSMDDKGLKSRVSEHFGRCPFYTFVDIKNQAIAKVEVMANPYFHSHQPGQLPQFIQQQNAQVIISGGMGRRAIALFDQTGIKALAGVQGQLQEVVEAHLKEELQSSGPCAESEKHHAQ